MKARFQIRAAGGREFTLSTLDAFVRGVHAGDISPYDLVFDALAGEWAPARSHPAYLLSVDPLVAAPEGGARLEEDIDAADAADGPRVDGIEAVEAEGSGQAVLPSPAQVPTMELVELDAPSPEHEKQAFIAHMEEERRLDPDRAPLEEEVTLVDPRAGMVSEITATRNEGVLVLPSGTATAAPRIGHRAPRASAPPRHRGSWVAFSALLCLGLAGTATAAWAALRGDGSLPWESAAVVVARTAPRPIVPAEAPVRAGAYEGFMHAVDSIRQSLGIGPVPDAWLQGHYLADPSAYPQVRDYWDRMAVFVQTVRERESVLYRDSYLAAAERSGMSGPTLSLRMAGAAGDFAALQPERDSLYARVWSLATAAISLDRTLFALKGRVAYEPVRGPRVSTDPVIEAVGTDGGARIRLGAALDRVLSAMRPLQNGQVTAEGAKVRVPMWLETGLRSLGTSID